MAIFNLGLKKNYKVQGKNTNVDCCCIRADIQAREAKTKL